MRRKSRIVMFTTVVIKVCNLCRNFPISPNLDNWSRPQCIYRVMSVSYYPYPAFDILAKIYILYKEVIPNMIKTSYHFENLPKFLWLKESRFYYTKLILIKVEQLSYLLSNKDFWNLHKFEEGKIHKSFHIYGSFTPVVSLP